MKTLLHIALIILLTSTIWSCSPKIVPLSTVVNTKTTVTKTYRDSTVMVPGDSLTVLRDLNTQVNNKLYSDSSVFLRADTELKGNIEVITQIKHGKLLVQAKELPHLVVVKGLNTNTTVRLDSTTTVVNMVEKHHIGFWEGLGREVQYFLAALMIVVFIFVALWLRTFLKLPKI